MGVSGRFSRLDRLSWAAAKSGGGVTRAEIVPIRQPVRWRVVASGGERWRAVASGGEGTEGTIGISVEFKIGGVGLVFGSGVPLCGTVLTCGRPGRLAEVEKHVCKK